MTVNEYVNALYEKKQLTNYKEYIKTYNGD